MESLYIAVALLPVIFMIHDFEEIILLPGWIRRNGDELSKRFPLLRKQFAVLQKMDQVSFTIAVAEEFIILGAVTAYALLSGHLFLWTALFLAFSVHIAIHLIQCAVIRKYVPAVITSVLCLPYIVYTTALIAGIYSLSELALCAVTGIIIMVINLRFAHFTGIKFGARQM